MAYMNIFIFHVFPVKIWSLDFTLIYDFFLEQHISFSKVLGQRYPRYAR